MKPEHLHELWSSPDNSRLLTKQFSFRFPVHIAAKINALCEIYPQKNRTQIVADLLASALDDLEKKLPFELYEAPDHIQHDFATMARDDGVEFPEAIYEIGGVRSNFRRLSNNYYQEYEKELGNDTPSKLYDHVYGTKKYLENHLK